MGLKDWVLRTLAIRQNVTTGIRFHVGPGTVLWAPRTLKIGRDVYVGKYVTIEVDGEIGDGVLIANAVNIVGRDDHEIAEIGTVIRRSRWVGNDPSRLSRWTVVGSDVWIGAGAIVLSGVRIGDSSIIGAGAVVTTSVPPNSIAVGNPARVIGKRFAPDDLSRHWSILEADGYRRIAPGPVESTA